MTSKIKVIFSTLFLLILLFGLAQPIPVQAAGPTGIITPNLVVNDITNTLTITCTDFTFVIGARVYIGVDEMAVTSKVIDATTLEAILPPGFTAGIHTVKIVNPDASTLYIEAGLTVQAPVVVPTPTQQPFGRPQVVVSGYSTSVSGIRYGQEFTLTVRLANSGGKRAYGIQVSMVSSELLMLHNGGVTATGNLEKGAAVDIAQTMTAANPFYGQSNTALEMNVSYYDEAGVTYTDRFSLNLGVYNTYSGGAAAATATPTGVHLSQLIISEYQIDVPVLQPGLIFKLTLTVKNMGDLTAKAVTMIVGGGSASSGGGTPGPGGISGSGGDFSNFAPVGTSNVQLLGDIPSQSSLEATQQLVVNVNTNPGAYPMKVTFSYTDAHGVQVNDEQVITLLVYSLPSIDVSFYQPVSELYTYQANLLPLQVVNLGRKSAMLGNIVVTSTAGMVENGQTFVGPLEVGGYFTLDVMLTPEMAGDADVLVTINYIDDFNQPRTITQTLTVPVVEMQIDPGIDPNMPVDGNGGIISEPTETIGQKIWRFILGLFGLDSSAPSSNSPIQVDPGLDTQPIPAPLPGGKG
jgi:hypothetical protein